jgi:hypothetical protein
MAAAEMLSSVVNTWRPGAAAEGGAMVTCPLWLLNHLSSLLLCPFDGD